MKVVASTEKDEIFESFVSPHVVRLAFRKRSYRGSQGKGQDINNQIPIAGTIDNGQLARKYSKNFEGDQQLRLIPAKRIASLAAIKTDSRGVSRYIPCDLVALVTTE